MFRVADELEATAYVRELFDEPTAKLYQVPGLLEAADVALDPESGIDRETVLRQLDLVATAIADVTDGLEEADLIAQLAHVCTTPRCARGATARRGRPSSPTSAHGAAAIVNEFFGTRLLAYERVRELVDHLAVEDSA